MEIPEPPPKEEVPFVPPWMIPPELWEQQEIDIEETIQDEDETFRDGD